MCCILHVPVIFYVHSILDTIMVLSALGEHVSLIFWWYVAVGVGCDTPSFLIV